MSIRHVIIYSLFPPNEQRGGGRGGGEGCAARLYTRYVVIFSQFSRPRAGLATV